MQSILLILCASAASAQEAATPAQAVAPAVKPKVDTVPIAEIGSASEEAKSDLSEMANAAKPKEEIAQISAAMPEWSDRVAQQLERSERVRLHDASVFELDRLQRHWDALATELEANQAILDERSKEIEGQVDDIRKLRTIWGATHEAALASEVSPEIIEQIVEVEAAGKTAYDKVNDRQGAVLGLQSDIASLREKIKGELKAVAETRNALVGMVFQRDTMPIWSHEFWEPLNFDEMKKRLRAHEEREQMLLEEYWGEHRFGILAYLVLTAFLAASLVAARSRIHARLEGDELAPIRAIFDRPISLALLISFFVAIFASPETGRVLAPVLGAASLIPAVLILRQIVDRPLFPLLNLVMGVYFLHQLREIFSTLPGLYRLGFVLESLILIVVCGAWLRPARLRDIPREMATSWLFRGVGLALRIVFFLSAAALAANLAGYGALANLIGRTLIWSMYAAVVLYGATRVADAIVAFLLRVRPLKLLGMVSRHRWLIRKRANLIVHVGAWYLWVTATLRRAELRDNVETAISGFLASDLPIPDVEITIGDILASGITFYVALLLSRFIRFLLEEDVYPHLSLPKGRPYAVSTLIHYVFVIIGFLLAATALGFDMNRFTLLAGAFGVGIGFGLQTIVNNFLSGIILLTERPVEVGDTIALGDVFGEVQRIGIRSSTVRTWQGAEVIVPNADLISLQVTNWTLSDRRRRMEIPVGVEYGSDPRQVMDTLLVVGRNGEHVLAEPSPYVLFKGFGESSLDFELRAWTDEFDSFLQVRSQLCTQVAAALDAAGLRIPFPQRDLHLKTTPEATQASSQSEIPLAPAVTPTDDRDDRDRNTG